MVATTTGVVVLGTVWGVVTTISQLYVAEKVKRRTGLTGGEIVAAATAISIASLLAIFFIRRRD